MYVRRMFRNKMEVPKSSGLGWHAAILLKLGLFFTEIFRLENDVAFLESVIIDHCFLLFFVEVP
jgi:hypothetical protein